MGTHFSSDKQDSWTWADMFHSYRFWGIVLLYSATLQIMRMLQTWLPLRLDEATNNLSHVSTLYAIWGASALFGFFIAWAATRSNIKAVLFIAAILQFLGVLLMTVIYPTTLFSLRLVYLGAGILGIANGALTLSFPAILAGGKSGSQNFIIATGVVGIYLYAAEVLSPMSVGIMIDRYGSLNLLAIFTIGLAFLGLLALLPVNPALFTQPPRVRTCNWAVRPRNATLVGIGSIFSLFYYYFLYRLHGEIASLRRSPKLLSPWGSLTLVLVVPFVLSIVVSLMVVVFIGSAAKFVWIVTIILAVIQMAITVIILTSLADALKELAVEHGRPAIYEPWVIFILGVLILPLAMGLLQDALNKSISMIEQAAVTNQAYPVS